MEMKELIIAFLAALVVFSVLFMVFYRKFPPKKPHTSYDCPVCDEKDCDCHRSDER